MDHLLDSHAAADHSFFVHPKFLRQRFRMLGATCIAIRMIPNYMQVVNWKIGPVCVLGEFALFFSSTLEKEAGKLPCLYGSRFLFRAFFRQALRQTANLLGCPGTDEPSLVFPHPLYRLRILEPFDGFQQLFSGLATGTLIPRFAKKAAFFFSQPGIGEM